MIIKNRHLCFQLSCFHLFQQRDHVPVPVHRHNQIQWGTREVGHFRGGISRKCPTSRVPHCTSRHWARDQYNCMEFALSTLLLSHLSTVKWFQQPPCENLTISTIRGWGHPTACFSSKVSERL